MNGVSLFPVVCGIMFLVFAGGILSMLKTALASLREARLRALIEGGSEKYFPVLKALEKSDFFLTSLKIWISFLEIFAGCLGGFFLSVPLERLFFSLGFPSSPARILAVLPASGGILVFFFVFCEVIPRQIALAFPETLCAALLPLIRFVSLPVYPLFLASRGISAPMAKLLSAGASRRGMTEAELRHTLIEGEKSGVVESEERTMVEGVFYLGDRPVSAFMTHRSEIRWLDIDSSPEEAKNAAENSSSQTCFPVADGDLDKVTGVVSLQDVFSALLCVSWPGLKSVMRHPYFIPETMSALKAFEAFKKADANYLFVMDEYGGFSGILTVRNLIEEIVGALSASGGGEETIAKQDDGTWLADGGVSIDDAAAELDLASLGEEQSGYHTLAGFILYLAGEIPQTGACFDYNGYRFKIAGMDNNRIDKIIISKI